MPSTRNLNQTDSLGTVTDGDIIFLEGGTLNITTNLDQSGLTQGLDQFIVGRNWRTNIGTPATPLLADLDYTATSMLWYNAAGGTLWYTPSGDEDLCHLIRCTGHGNLILTGVGTVTRVEHGRGRTVVGGSIVMTNLDLAGGNVEHQAGTATAPTTLTLTGGSYDSKRGLNAGGNLYLYGGLATFDTTDAIPNITFTGGRLRIQRSGTITAFNVLGGDLRNVEISRPITITNCTIWASVPGMSDFLDNSYITFTNTPTRRIAPFSGWR